MEHPHPTRMLVLPQVVEVKTVAPRRTRTLVRVVEATRTAVLVAVEVRTLALVEATKMVA